MGSSRRRRLPGNFASGGFCQPGLQSHRPERFAARQSRFFVKQLVAVIFSSAWAFVFTLAMLKIINMFTPVKVDQASEEIGLDEALHGERAYEESLSQNIASGSL